MTNGIQFEAFFLSSMFNVTNTATILVWCKLGKIRLHTIVYAKSVRTRAKSMQILVLLTCICIYLHNVYTCTFLGTGEFLGHITLFLGNREASNIFFTHFFIFEAVCQLVSYK